ncbi:MAG TPA: hypothetical protein VEC16_00395 [Alphaproteobacteria bacterium]|nr:hypothetical protein [Alphaproteobacteria bacterium]
MGRLYDENNPDGRLFYEKETKVVSMKTPYDKTQTRNLLKRLKPGKTAEKIVAALSIAASGYLLGGYVAQDERHENQVRLPETVIGAPANMALIDYAFDEQPSRQVTKITLLPEENYRTLINSNGRLTIKGNVNYDIDCRGIDDAKLCNDTRECQLTFKTIDDKLKE